MITLEFRDAKFNLEFNQIIKNTEKPKLILLAGGREVTLQLKKHFLKRDSEGNKMGGKPQGFWKQIGRSVNQPELESPTTVSVTISDPRFAQKLFGGEIHAKQAGALTIPLTPAAYGHTASQFPGSFILRTVNGAFIVQYGENITVSGIISRRKRGEYKPIRAGLNFLFKLVDSVDQVADPEALPQKSELEKAILARAQATLDREISDKTISQ